MKDWKVRYFVGEQLKKDSTHPIDVYKSDRLLSWRDPFEDVVQQHAQAAIGV